MGIDISLRDNLLVTAGTRVAYLHCMELIALPWGVEGEEILAKYVVEVVDKYMTEPEVRVENFDLYVEELLMMEYGRKSLS